MGLEDDVAGRRRAVAGKPLQHQLDRRGAELLDRLLHGGERRVDQAPQPAIS